MSTFSRDGEHITLALRIVYRDAKADIIRAALPTKAVRTLQPLVRKDIKELGLTQPKTIHIVKSTTMDNAVDMFWPSARIESQLDKTLRWACEKVTPDDLVNRSIETLAIYHLPPDSALISAHSHCSFALHSTTPPNPPEPHPLHSSPPKNAPLAPRSYTPTPDQSMQHTEHQQRFAAVSRQRDRIARDIQRLEDEADASAGRANALRAQLALLNTGGRETGQDRTLRDLRERLARAEDTASTVRQRLQAIGNGKSAPSTDGAILDAMAAVETRVAHLRAQIDAETAGCRDAEARLQEENARFARAVERVRTEGREPFVVPALLEAFLSVSSMAAQVTR
ncbi:hypothetical protein OF83DRAFT_1126059 [Amylostereum chailletii]|nr:hypothetical protein OF83DRAFT_1126059 [Amylostereum chailletii]